MATFVQILDNEKAWEYYQAGLLWASWLPIGVGEPERRMLPGGWYRDEWMCANFDGAHSMRNYICVEE